MNESVRLPPASSSPVSLFQQIKERRLFQIVATYAAAGWVILEVVNSLIERGILPEIVYNAGFTLFVGGFLASLVTGWFHGEKGHQQVTPPEVALLTVIGLGTLAWTASDVSEHLREARVAEARAVGVPLSRVAVRYFEDLAPDSTAFLGDALTEGVISQLQGVDGLDVVSANAVRPYRGTDVPPDSIGRALNVGTLVDGTVEQTPDEVRINVRLLEGTSGVEMARAMLERPLDEVVSAPEAVAEEVAELFRRELGEEVRLREVAAGSDDVEAWRALQQAERIRRNIADGRAAAAADPAAAARADDLLETAGRLDPDWVEVPLARARLALDYVQRLHDPAARAEWVGRGIAQADRALEMEPDLPEALETRGMLRLFGHLAQVAHDASQHAAFLADARDDLERAVRLDRGLAAAHASLSVLYYQPGVADLPQAALAARQAYEADAYLRTADDVVERLFWTNLDMGQFTQARRWCDEGGTRFPDDPRFVACRLWLLTSPGASPDIDEGWGLRDRLVEVSPSTSVAVEDLRGRMLMGAALGRAAEAAGAEDRKQALADSAVAVLERAHDDYATMDDPRRELFAVEAFAWVILDDFDRAIERWKAYAALNHGFQQSGDISWRWRELREHPRFQEVVTQDGAHH